MDQKQNAPVDFSTLLDAFEFVSSGSRGECEAWLSLDTGECYLRNDYAGIDELPEDLDESDRHIPVPHKNDLDLRRDLVIAFTEQENRAAERALREWCEEIGVSLSEGCPDANPERRE
jgi:hypothetical protein